MNKNPNVQRDAGGRMLPNSEARRFGRLRLLQGSALRLFVPCQNGRSRRAGITAPVRTVARTVETQPVLE